MDDPRKMLFVGIMLFALILVLVGTGAWPVLVQIVVSIAQALGGFLWGLVPKGR